MGGEKKGWPSHWQGSHLCFLLIVNIQGILCKFYEYIYHFSQEMKMIYKFVEIVIHVNRLFQRFS